MALFILISKKPACFCGSTECKSNAIRRFYRVNSGTLPVIMKRAQNGASYTIPHSILPTHTPNVKKKLSKDKKK